MSEEPKAPKSPPPRHRPRLSELSRETTEQDLWDLDAEPAGPAAEKKESEDASAAAAAGEGSADDSGETSAAPEFVGGQAASAPAPGDDPPVEPEVAPPGRSGASPAAEEKPAPRPEAAPAPGEARASPAAGPTGPSPARPGRREMLSLGLLGVVFVGLAIWWIAGQFSDIPTRRLGGDQPDLPVQGEHARVKDAETYWRAPVRGGGRRDVAGPEVSFIPVISVELGGGSGALRAIYRNENGGFVGDSITRSFENGRFAQTGEPSIEFPATDGYKTDGEYNGYRVGDARWTVEILEGPSANAPGSSFQTLFTAPVSPERR